MNKTPDAVPAEERSALVDTEIPVSLSTVALPIATPARVMQMMPAGMEIPATVRTTELCPVAPILKIWLGGPTMVRLTLGAKKPPG